jgi:hypothetical protein
MEVVEWLVATVFGPESVYGEVASNVKRAASVAISNISQEDFG